MRGSDIADNRPVLVLHITNRLWYFGSSRDNIVLDNILVKGAQEVVFILHISFILLRSLLSL